MGEQILGDFLMLLVTIDPIGTLSIFITATGDQADAVRTRVALRSILYAAIVLVAFIVVGQIVLTGMGVRLESFQLAGGLILFLLAVQMVFGTGVAAQTPKPEEGHDVAVFPLAIPSIASPGSIMAVVLLTDNHRQSIPQQLVTTAVLALVLIITLMAMLQANRILRWIGQTGANVLVRVMGLLLAALAVEQVVAGVLAITDQIPAN